MFLEVLNFEMRRFILMNNKYKIKNSTTDLQQYVSSGFEFCNETFHVNEQQVQDKKHFF